MLAWPVIYTLSSSLSLFVTLLVPFLLILYIYNPEYYVIGNNSESDDWDSTPKEGFATLLLSLWEWYRILLFDKSSLQNDYEKVFDK
jgi:hypothetical protein